MAAYVLAIDQGTTSTRAILFRGNTSIAVVAQQEFPQHFPADGEVEHEPDDLWSSTLATCRAVLHQAGASAENRRLDSHRPNIMPEIGRPRNDTPQMMSEPMCAGRSISA